MSSNSQQSQSSGPPWVPNTASLGGIPTVSVDVPIDAVFLALFIVAAASHMTLFRRNKARGHKFIPSGATFGFCMARIVANILRIVWACYQHNVRVAIASQIFVAAGVVVLFILNLLYSQRLLRAAHPRLGWSRPVSYLFKALYALVIISLAMLITVTVQSFYTLNTNTRRIDRDVQLYGSTYFMTVSFLPFVIIAYILLAPRSDTQRIEKFGKGRWRTKIRLLCATTFLLCLGASFRCGTSYKNPRPATDPAWYQHKACFYIFNFGVEICTVYIYLFGRFDQRFYVPDGSSKVRHYRGNSAGEASGPKGYEQQVRNEDGDEESGLDTLPIVDEARKVDYANNEQTVV
ncbi:hypothetical protein DTO207G8_6393 [Paecilomyces variotii]|nr:hypothetical protein DTO207G8_6393 [Paecilomyces variotii]KAJ9288690.1 hypothetical protein DTO021C3_3719 [Paecilomyces variotii]KAJ9391423.1 hypothetical protein DTO063F5_1033 [Paecilomyces variotii]